VEEKPDRPIAEWPDDQLLEEYRSPTANRPDKATLTEEILRRGLTIPDGTSVPDSEVVDWSGEAGGEDPGSGALPRPF
jgi:hypothetical protein